MNPGQPASSGDALRMIREMTAGLPPDAQRTVAHCVGLLREMVKRYGPLAQMAIGQLGAELAGEEEAIPRAERGPYTPSQDPRYVYGASCVWHGPIQAAGERPRHKGSRLEGGLPCCPHCKGVLYEMASKAEWDAFVGAHEELGHTNYTAFQEWIAAQPRCFRTMEAAAEAFRSATGETVALTLV